MGTVLIAAIVVALIFATTMPVGAYIQRGGYFNNASASAGGGNITSVDFTSTGGNTTKWQGYYGIIISNGISLKSGSDAMIEWGMGWNNSTTAGYVLATTNSSIPDWVGLTNVTCAEIDDVWSFGVLDGDSATNTFNNSNSTQVTIGGINHTAGSTTNAYTLNGSQGTNYTWETSAFRHSGAVSAGNYDSFVFVGVNDESRNDTAFNDNLADYQMLVPVNATGQTYNFYVELN